MSPDRHAATRSHCGSSSSSPPTSNEFGTRTLVSSPQCQSFSRSYGSILLTFLAYIIPSTRGCSPLGPDVVSVQFSTVTRLLVHPVSLVLLTKNSPLGALDSMARPDKAVAGPIPKSEERFAYQYRYGHPPEFPLASPRSGIVHHLLGPDRYAHTRTLLGRSRSVSRAPLGRTPPISFLTPYGFTHPLTHTHVRFLGPFL
ncbi:hypothetical protein BC332_33852 [Capsicum chinense]|nr:hypothetical protein BC332_33852 [Capsicum chinense]